MPRYAILHNRKGIECEAAVCYTRAKANVLSTMFVAYGIKHDVRPIVTGAEASAIWRNLWGDMTPADVAERWDASNGEILDLTQVRSSAMWQDPDV